MSTKFNSWFIGPTPNRNLNHFGCFCRVLWYDQHTNIQTEIQTMLRAISVAIGCIYHCMQYWQCGLITVQQLIWCNSDINDFNTNKMSIFHIFYVKFPTSSTGHSTFFCHFMLLKIKSIFIMQSIMFSVLPNNE